jgi:Uncharacterised nucleotidyltransferase
MKSSHWNFSPELQLLLCCAGSFKKGETVQQMMHLIQQGIDWKALLEIAEWYSLSPLLFHSLSQICPELVPDEALQELRSAFYINAINNQHLSLELSKILDSLQRQGIEAIPYKGPILASLAYGDITLRCFRDLDLLVHQKDFSKPWSILKEQGYRPLNHLTYYPNEQSELDAAQDFGEYALIRQKDGVCLDIHCRLASIGAFTLSANFDSFWERLQPVDLEDTTVLSFCLEDTLLYLCVSGVRDAWDLLLSICDIAALIHRHPELNWDQLMHQADTLKVRRMLLLGIFLAHQIFDLPLPPRVIAQIDADPQIQVLAMPIFDRLLHPDFEATKIAGWKKFTSQIATIDQLSEKLRFVQGMLSRTVRYSFRLNQKDISFWQFSSPFPFVYYLLRPIRLLKDHGLHIFRLIFPM